MKNSAKNIFTKTLFLIIFFSYTKSSFAISLSDFWVGEPATKNNQRKLSSVKGKNFMISTADELASKSAAEIIKKGGNAIDAAIAAQLVLNLVEPQSSGIGGGGFLLYYNAKTKKTEYFNGRETAPDKSYSAMFMRDNKPRSFDDVVRGGLSVATPGVLKIMFEAHQKYGKIEWKELFAPAIKLAREGFMVSPRLHTLSSQISLLKDSEEAAKIYLKANKQPYQIGEVIKNPAFAETLEIIANKGIEPFYKGKIARDIAKTVNNSKINPGLLSTKDLKNYHSKKGDLICANYRIKYKICSMPLPSSGGVTILQIMGILENFDLVSLKPYSIEELHLIIEATKLAYADRNSYLADKEMVPIKNLLDKEYLKKRSELIDKKSAIKAVEAGVFSEVKNNQILNIKSEEPPSTTHLSIVDSEKNAVSFTSSIEYFFGSGLMVDGFFLNNQMTDFSFLPEINGKKVANAIEPNKSPRSSMSPTFIFDNDDNLIAVLGSPGGPRIIQYTARVIIQILDHNIDIQEAVSNPNFVVLNEIVELEKNSEITKLKKDLEKLGHQVEIKDQTSGIHAIKIDNDNLLGAADPRRDGVAIGE
jgi:gamma-glutamyltranspeptidase/glutathione hydrolase